jgi:hypothetical protein
MAGQQLYATPKESRGNFSMSLNAIYSGKRIYRGALIWDAPIALVMPGFTLFNVFGLGHGGLSFFKQLNQQHRLALGYSSFDDNRPSGPVWRIKDSEEDYKNLRAESSAIYLLYSYKNRPHFNFMVRIERGVKAHQALYLYSKISTSPLPFTTIGVATGVGERDHNRYIYGDSAVSGLAHVDSFISAMLPFLPWQGRLILNLSYSTVAKRINRDAEYILSNKGESNFGAVASWSLF